MAYFTIEVMKCSCVILILTIFVLHVDAGFLEQFCKSKCNVGLGGNLCKCNGFHFAGKRTSSSDQFLKNVQKARDSYYNGLDSDLNTEADDDLDSSFFDEDSLDGSFIRNEEQKLEKEKKFIEWLMNKVEKNRFKNLDSQFNEFEGRIPE